MTSNEHFQHGSSRTRSQQQQNGNNTSVQHSKSLLNKSSSSSSTPSSMVQHQTTTNKPPECYGCHKPILERYFLKALDQIWHEDCLKCSCCNCRLGEIGSTLFTKADLILCKRDYLRMFGVTGFCSLCNKQIPAFEMVMRARGNVYHLECFKCEACNHRFCVGDRFYLHDNKILCEYDYEEQMTLIHHQQQHPPHPPPSVHPTVHYYHQPPVSSIMNANDVPAVSSIAPSNNVGSSPIPTKTSSSSTNPHIHHHHECQNDPECIKVNNNNNKNYQINF